MKNTYKNSKRTLIALGALLPLIAGAQDLTSDHGAATAPNAAAIYQSPNRDKQNTSNYDLLIQKLEGFEKTAIESNQTSQILADEVVTKLGKSQIKTALESIKKIKAYRDAVEKQCKGIDESASLLVDTIDFCVAKNVIYPGVQNAKLNLGIQEVVLLSKALNSCQTELRAYFVEKGKKAQQGKLEISSDKTAQDAFASLFDLFGGKKLKQDETLIESSELIKSLKNLDAKNLCQAKVEFDKKPTDSNSTQTLTEKQEVSIEEDSKTKHSQPKSVYKEKEEETIEEEETYIPYEPKIKTVAPEQPAPQPIAQPVQQPAAAPQPVPYQPVKPTYQPTQQPKANNNTPSPFIPVTPTPKRAPVVAGGGGGPVPVGGPIARGFGGGFGLSLGFGTYSSTVTAPLMPYPPMPYPPMPMPMTGAMPIGGGMVGGISSSPRACLVCSTVTPMPTLGLGTMLQRPCTSQIGMQPIGACRPNMNQPYIGYGGMTPIYNQIPRVPGSPVYPGVTPQPTINGGGIIPNRTTIPRTTSLVGRTSRRVRR